jgi:hypothetical protein
MPLPRSIKVGGYAANFYSATHPAGEKSPPATPPINMRHYKCRKSKNTCAALRRKNSALVYCFDLGVAKRRMFVIVFLFQGETP